MTASMEDAPVNGLQRIVLNERHRLIRFLAARGAGDEAEDLLHDLWQKVGTQPERPIADPLSYLYRAAENLVRDSRRAMLSRGKRQHDWQDVTTAPEDQFLGERALIAREQLQEIHATLHNLGSRTELVFRRFRLEGVGQAAIARELGISLSSVEKDLQRAYRALAELRAKFDAE